MTIRVLAQGPQSEVLEQSFEGAELVLGRGEGISLPDSKVSKRHLRLRVIEGALFAKDLDSANGTLINDEPLKGEWMITPRDRLKVGDSWITAWLMPALPAVIDHPTGQTELTLRAIDSPAPPPLLPPLSMSSPPPITDQAPEVASQPELDSDQQMQEPTIILALADPFTRVLGYWVDLVAIGAVGGGLVIGLGLGHQASWWQLGLGGFALHLAYFGIWAIVTQGRTPGKLLLGLDIVNYRGQEMGRRALLVRETLGRCLCLLSLGLGYFWAFIRQQQGWHDKIVHSRVIVLH